MSNPSDSLWPGDATRVDSLISYLEQVLAASTLDPGLITWHYNYGPSFKHGINDRDAADFTTCYPDEKGLYYEVTFFVDHLSDKDARITSLTKNESGQLELHLLEIYASYHGLVKLYRKAQALRRKQAGYSEEGNPNDNL